MRIIVIVLLLLGVQFTLPPFVPAKAGKAIVIVREIEGHDETNL